MSKHRGSPIQTSFLSQSNKMASNRRLKIYGLIIFIAITSFFIYQSRSRSSPEFYSKTVSALDKKAGTAGAAGKVAAAVDEESKAMQQRLKEAADSAKEKANAKAPRPDPPSAVVGKGNAAEGAAGDRGVGGRRKHTVDTQKPAEETAEEHDAEVELNLILKKAPIIIFSKSYCPHSKRAKSILLGKYIIDPAPHVVELDQHPIGLQIQALLADKTSRRTVPNVLINGISIGGGDDVADLDAKKTLVEKILELGGKKMIEVKEKPVEASEENDLR